MKLERLELFGFKSFADRVTVEFNPGITAIVGPNGCGKSNISDAIRWVLGEQRPSLVRGARMDEVIFSGSRDRKPINLAEVTLHFSNEDGLLPVEYTEVAIARRVFRDGESDYLLNKHSCRLRDIQDLLMGTGVGTHSYSLIQQGMVDSLLSDRAEERRTIFEEAAGVTRYKNRRRATERKLEATSADLDRVEDIVGEVERNVASLKRQVGKARRFLRYRAEETRLDVHLAASELEDLARRSAPLEEEIKSLQRRESELAAKLGEREAGVETMELELVDMRRDEQALRSEAEAVRARITRREEARLVNGETLKHHRRRLEALAEEAEQARFRSDDLAERRANLEVDLAAAREAVERSSSQAPSDDHDIDETRHAELKTEQKALIERLESLRERMSEIEQAHARQQTAAETVAARLVALETALAERADEVVAAESDEEAARRSVHVAEEERARAQSEREETANAAERLTAAVEEIRDRLAEARAAEQAAAGRLEALTDLESRFEGYASGVRALLADGESADGVYGALPRMIVPREARFERPLERYLEGLGHGLLAANRAAARTAAERLEAESAGRADFLVPDLIAVAEPPAIPDRAAALVVCRGSDAVRWTADRKLDDAFGPLFERLLIVANEDDCFDCRDALGEDTEAARFYVVAALDGTVIEPVGRWRTAGAETDDGLLSRQRHLSEAEAECETRSEAVRALVAELRDREREADRAETARAAAEQRWQRADEAYRDGRERLVVAQEAVSNAIRSRGQVESDIGSQKAERDRAFQAREAVAETRAELAMDVERATQRLTAVRTALERFEETRTERLSARHAVELEQTAAEANLRAVEREMEHLESAEAGLDEDRAGRAAERARLEEECKRLEAETARTSEEIENLCDELDEAEEKLSKHRARLAEVESKRAGHDNELRALRREHDEIVEKRHADELAMQQIAHRRDTTRAHLAETYDEPLDALVAAHPLEEGEQELALDEMRDRLDGVRRKRANLGPVNMLAVEEFDTESERLEFLVKQRDDLVASRRQLEEAIRKINRTARELFTETFEQITENFTMTFQTLFEGGTARIELEDPDDPLETPIQIAASPRGKRVQSINLLSGGERALTALALLFAIYRVKPSPFCILDEVDAPLDDANISRFIHMIRTFSDDTQFVVITHNKRTMEAADYLYGVTMEEPGVSALVSVALDAGVEAESDLDESPEREEAALVAAG